MEKKLGLYFQVEANDKQESLSIVRQALNRLNQLELEGVDVQYFELRVKKEKELLDQNEISMKLDGNGCTVFIENEIADRWDKAFTNAFDKIHDHVRGGQLHKTVNTLQYA